MTTIQITNLGRQQRMVCENGHDLYDHDLVKIELYDAAEPVGLAHIAVTEDRRGWSIINAAGAAKRASDWELIASII